MPTTDHQLVTTGLEHIHQLLCSLKGLLPGNHHGAWSPATSCHIIRRPSCFISVSPCEKLLPRFLIPAGIPYVPQSYDSSPAPIQELSLSKCSSTFNCFRFTWAGPQNCSPAVRSGLFPDTTIYLRATNPDGLCI